MSNKKNVKVYKLNDFERLKKESPKLSDSQIAYFEKDKNVKVGEIKQQSFFFRENFTKIMLFLIGFIGVITSLQFDYTEEPIYFAIGVIVAIWGFGLGLMLFIKDYKGNKEGDKDTSKIDQKDPPKLNFMEGLETDDKYMLSFVFTGFLLSGILVIINYTMEISNEVVTYSIVAIVQFVIIVMIFYRRNHVKSHPNQYDYLTEIEKNSLKKLRESNEISETRLILESKSFVWTFFLIQHLLLMILTLFAIPLLMGHDLLTTLNLPYIDTVMTQFSICMFCVSASGLLGILQMRKIKNARDGDLDKTNLARYLIMIIAPLFAILNYPMSYGFMEGKLVEGGLYSAQLGDFDFFNGVYMSIVSSPYTQFSMVIIIISALSIIIGKARGQSGTATMVIGSLGMAGIPMMITIMAFIGAVPAPPQFYQLFGEGFGDLVFAISYTSVISLALALVGVFYEIVPSAVSGNL